MIERTESKKLYPSSPEIKRILNAYSRTGMRIGSVEIKPNGSILIRPNECAPNAPANDFDQYKDQL